MTKPTLHFVYATPNTLVDKLTMRLVHRKLAHPEWDKLPWPEPLKAPLCITYQVARHFSGRYPVKVYDLRERLEIVPEPGDVLLGHGWPDPKSLLWRAMADPRFSRRYLMAPYNHDPRQVEWVAPLVERCDKFFAISGQFWIDSFDKSPLAPYRDKVVRLNMGLDTADYPVVKTSFNPPGKRGFFYVGRAGHEKGVDLLEQMAATVPGFRGGYISVGGEIKGWQRISEPTDLTPELMRQVASEYDVFLNMSRADAQVTTVLEAMSWGFPVACTRESGYSREPSLFYLSLDDAEGNARVLRRVQELESEQLAELARLNRRIVETDYNWQGFLATLEEHL
jgi:glycosyltransferase involved in cell wall biosynthesis